MSDPWYLTPLYRNLHLNFLQISFFVIQISFTLNSSPCIFWMTNPIMLNINRNYRTVRAISRVSWQENYLCFSEVKILAVVLFLCVNVQPHQASRLEFSSNLLESRFSESNKLTQAKNIPFEKYFKSAPEKMNRRQLRLECFFECFFFSLYINDIFSSLDIEFQWSIFQISEIKWILTTPKSLNSTKSYETCRNVLLDARKGYFVIQDIIK